MCKLSPAGGPWGELYQADIYHSSRNAWEIQIYFIWFRLQSWNINWVVYSSPTLPNGKSFYWPSTNKVSPLHHLKLIILLSKSSAGTAAKQTKRILLRRYCNFIAGEERFFIFVSMFRLVQMGRFAVSHSFSHLLVLSSNPRLSENEGVVWDKRKFRISGAARVQTNFPLSSQCSSVLGDLTAEEPAG